MFWINFLHLYQPANIDGEKVEEATKLSYERLVRALEENPQIKFTLNISGCLVKRWDEEFHYGDLISRIKRLVERRQVELVGSAAYHVLLPLVGEEEARAQILENEEILRRYFGDNLELKGFFFPEMAFGRKAAKLIKELGYEWAILDEISCGGRLGHLKNKKYLDRASGLTLLFRNRKYSESYVPATIAKLIDENKQGPVVTASDAELYGLRHLDHSAEFERLLKNESLKTQTASEYLQDLTEAEAIEAVEASWQSSPRELRAQKPYILWYNRSNRLHLKLWQLADTVQEYNKKYAGDPHHFWARWHLVRGLASCVFWWSSGKDFRSVFGPVAWNPDEVERGINELIRSVRALENSTALEEKLAVEKLALEIKRMVWTRHWSYFKKSGK